jgi:hypothetical protein
MGVARLPTLGQDVGPNKSFFLNNVVFVLSAFGKISAKSADDDTPIHSIKGAHIDSNDSVGIIRPRPVFKRPCSVRSFGYLPNNFPPFKAPPAQK